jgi:parallel beta-helix repeat protein
MLGEMRMLKRTFSVLMLTLLLTGMLTLAFNIQPVKAKTITVPDEYPTIQQAIYAASPRDTIYVKAGEYRECVVVTKTVRLVGENEKWPTIRSALFEDEKPDIVLVKADGVVIEGFTIRGIGSGSGEPLFRNSGIRVDASNVTILNNNISGWGGIGIYIAYGASFATISKNNISNYEEGIMVEYAQANMITENNISGNREYGIYLGGSTNNTVTNNNISNNGYGISLSGTSNNRFRNNHLSGNRFNVAVSGNDLLDFINDVDSSNTVDGKPVYYLVNQQGRSIPGNAGYVALVNSTCITVQNLDLKNNGQGVLLAYTENSLIVGNNISDNVEGIELISSSNNTIAENTLLNNGDGISISASSNNKIYHNNFVINQHNVWLPDDSANVWDDGYPSGGNYWSDYKERYPSAEELDGPGIWDTPYIIKWKNQDRYPLVKRWAIQKPPPENESVSPTPPEGLPIEPTYLYILAVLVIIIAIGTTALILHRKKKPPEVESPHI